MSGTSGTRQQGVVLSNHLVRQMVYHWLIASPGAPGEADHRGAEAVGGDHAEKDGLDLEAVSENGWL